MCDLATHNAGLRCVGGARWLCVNVDIRLITVGHVHAEAGDPRKIAAFHGWLQENPDSNLPAIDVRAKDNGTYRIHDGRHRFLAYVLAGRATIPIEVGGTTPP